MCFGFFQFVFMSFSRKDKIYKKVLKLQYKFFPFLGKDAHFSVIFQSYSIQCSISMLKLRLNIFFSLLRNHSGRPIYYLGFEMLNIMVKPIQSPSNQDRLKLFHNFIDWFAEHISGLKAKKGPWGAFSLIHVSPHFMELRWI